MARKKVPASPLLSCCGSCRPSQSASDTPDCVYSPQVPTIARLRFGKIFSRWNSSTPIYTPSTYENRKILVFSARLWSREAGTARHAPRCCPWSAVLLLLLHPAYKFERVRIYTSHSLVVRFQHDYRPRTAPGISPATLSGIQKAFFNAA